MNGKDHTMGGAESGPGTFLEASEGVSTFSLPLSKRSSSDHPAASVGRPVHSSRADGAGRDLMLIQTTMYEASVTILVGQERGITDTPNDVVGLQQLTQTMVGG
jgi:hypothetical protein